VYNFVTGKIVETINIKFLENLPSLEGTGQPLLFDIDYLTDSLNYARIRSTNLSAGNQGLSSNNAGCQDSDSDSGDKQDVIIVQHSPTPMTTPVHDVPIPEEAAQSVLSLSLDLNDDDMEELSSLQTQEQEGKDAAQRLGLAFPTHVVTNEASSIPTEKSSLVSPASTPTASAGNIPLVSPKPSAGRSSKSTGKKLASSSKTPIFAGRSVSVEKSIPADRSVSADKSISADRSISASRDTNSVDRHPSKLSSNAVLERFPPASNTQNSDIHDGLKLFDCPSTGIFSSLSYDNEYHGPDISNQEKEILVNLVTTKKVNEAHPHSLILGDLHTPVQTRKKAKAQEELQQFQNQRVWVLVKLPEGKHAIGTKWILKNKRDAKGIVCRNKARVEAIRLFLAFASYMGFMVYQMDVKSAFLNGEIQEEVYVTQPKGFEDPKYPKRVYKVVKALYGLHQAPRAWYATLSSFLLKHGYMRGTIDQTLFFKKDSKDIILVQVYVDDIIFGSTRQDWSDEFEALMQSQFEMSSMGQLTFFLGLQVDQRSDGIFIHQTKYVNDILYKFDMDTNKSAPTLFEPPKIKDTNLPDGPVNVHLYRSMIGSLMRLISWQCKKQTIVATSSCKAEYVVAASCCGQQVKGYDDWSKKLSGCIHQYLIGQAGDNTDKQGSSSPSVFTSQDSVATDRSIPAEEVVPADKGVSSASRNKGKGIAIESSVPQRKQTPQEIKQERTMAWANKFKGDDLIAEYNKIKSAVERSTASQGVKRSGPTLAPGSPKKMKSTVGPSLGYNPADEVPADTGVSIDETVPADQRVPADQSVPADASIPAGTCVSAKAATTTIPVNAPLDEDEPAEVSSSLRRSTKKKSVAKKRTTPPSSSIPFSTDDPDAAHRVHITFASDDLDDVDTPHPIITDVHLLGWQVVPFGLGTIHTLLCHGGIRKTFTTLREIRHMVDRQTLIWLYGFVDALFKKQPLDGLALSL
nr:putative ribonuclease H-like domain-containing protein [Tanacetum cinerariifolium]